jgi:Zn2+/Cd2+-exporting ATPase
MTREEYIVSNLNCAQCSTKIEAEIEAMPEVNSANLDFLNKKLYVQYHTKIDNPLQRLNHIAGSIEPGVLFLEQPLEITVWRKYSYLLPIAIATVLIIISRFLSLELQFWFGILSYLLAGYRVLLAAGRSIVKKQVFSEHFLMGIATIGALVLGEYTEACAVMILFEIGQLLEERALEHSRGSIRSSVGIRPEIAHLKASEGLKECALRDVKTGDEILVYPGERVPLDGIITKGESTVDTSSLTGESEPLFVREGTEIYAGFLNNSGLLEIRVTGTEAESTITRIMNLIEEASSRKSPQEKFITRFARVYTPVVVLLALLVFLIPTFLGAPAAVWFKRSLIFLIVSCPCALVISIPLTYFIGIGIAARKGIIIKGSVFLDILRKVRTVLFDKTGTLTTGEMKLESVNASPGVNSEEMLQTLYLCEYTSSHPFAKAIKGAYTGTFESGKVDAYAEYPGKGVLLQYSGDRLIVGSGEFLREQGYVGLLDPEAQSVVHAVKNDIYLGCVTFSDEIKAGMKVTLHALKKSGVQRNIMLSGDKHSKAGQVSKELGLDGYVAELVPEQKLQILEEETASGRGKVAFVGDGMNDAPSLNRADVGIAMGGIGNQASIESADIVLLNDKPEQLTEAFNIARQTGSVVVQNIVLALGIKILVMTLGVAGLGNLWEAVIADVGVTLLVVFNSLRMLRGQSRT